MLSVYCMKDIFSCQYYRKTFIYLSGSMLLGYCSNDIFSCQLYRKTFIHLFIHSDQYYQIIVRMIFFSCQYYRKIFIYPGQLYLYDVRLCLQNLLFSNKGILD